MAAKTAEVSELKHKHAIEFTEMQQRRDNAHRRLAAADEEHVPDEYVPYVGASNPFHPRPPTMTLAPQVFPMYGNPTYDSLKRRGKDLESVLHEHVTLTGALPRFFDLIHAAESTREEYSEAIE